MAKLFNLADLEPDKGNSDLRIEWEKWKDPYGENINEVEWPGWNDETDVVAIDQPVTFDNETEDGDIEYDEDDIEAQISNMQEPESQGVIKKPLRIVATPLGIIPLTEYTIPSKIFNFWMGHTNFPITAQVRDILENTDGVETLDIYTKYRMKIGFGKLFTAGEVSSKILSTIKAEMTSI